MEKYYITYFVLKQFLPKCLVKWIMQKYILQNPDFSLCIDEIKFYDSKYDNSETFVKFIIHKREEYFGIYIPKISKHK